METSSSFFIYGFVLVFVALPEIRTSFSSVQAPEKYSWQGRAIQGMPEVDLSLWICEFLLFFAGDQ
jgi:hypothetical protein